MNGIATYEEYVLTCFFAKMHYHPLVVTRPTTPTPSQPLPGLP